ncbi:hypothetical protein M527_29205 [Sphingobium indicum IP26]|uniref:hypothetical protein n=1 Tax=Sphingobium sp. HDIP04 TaxID=428994 RepID=UPI000376A9F8|nr:hypothetical protein [Sphingobium sp. HDIP04]EPR14193.1 hypothetical protein M527_29205 [Sphingobium indicum IP26]EQB03676.1 hypothetical protein L286_11670 [Sphingobium sp. HDIP04]
MTTKAEAEYIERVRIQASLAENFLLALLLINGVGLFIEPATRAEWGVGLFLAMLAFNCAFLSQHHFTIACQHEIEGRIDAERCRTISGNRWFATGMVLSFAAVAAVVWNSVP